MRNLILGGAVFAALLMPGTVTSADTGSNDRASFPIQFEGVVSDLVINTATVMPSATLRVRAEASASATGGVLKQDKGIWLWTAPDTPGRHELIFERNGEEILLNVFVLTPFANGKQDRLNGYRVGAYTKTLFRGLSSYAEPQGFIDLAHGPADLKVSPHFTLGQFICKQQPGHDPTYLLIRAATLVKLETLLEAANDKGWEGDSFHVMSGFRTPFYNASIGNRTTSSRHLYGGAADIWLDGDGDGRMDDLNNDGRVNKEDARELARLAESLAVKGGPNWPAGGVGIYGANAAHGPFVHIDSRGYRARW